MLDSNGRVQASAYIADFLCLILNIQWEFQDPKMEVR